MESQKSCREDEEGVQDLCQQQQVWQVLERRPLRKRKIPKGRQIPRNHPRGELEVRPDLKWCGNTDTTLGHDWLLLPLLSYLLFLEDLELDQNTTER